MNIKNEQEIIEYYSTHTGVDTCKQFGLKSNWLYKILEANNIPTHTVSDGVKLHACNAENPYAVAMNKKYSEFLSLINAEVFSLYYANHNTAETIEFFHIPVKSWFDKILKDFNVVHHTARETRNINYINTYGSIDAGMQIENQKRSSSMNYEENFKKIRATNQQKYGGDSPFSSKEIRDKRDATVKERYDVNNAFQIPGLIYHYSDPTESRPNSDFTELLESYNIRINKENKEFRTNNFRYDFKLDTNLIEINPYPTHNSTHGIKGKQPTDPNYHLHKSIEAKESGYRCIHIWDWDDKNKIIESLLLPKDKVYGRKCIIKEVEKQEAMRFINKYHLQGYANDSIRIGLFYDNNLVSIMTFGNPRYNKNYEYELIRYCSSCNVIGGSQKLFNYFIKQYDPTSVVSYCDFSKFTGDTYLKLGFKQISKKISPSKHWYNPKLNKHITNNLLLSKGFDKLLGNIFGIFGKGTSNEELMRNHGFVEIYDAGQITFGWKKIQN